jgi:branched-chain amino acid transport system ATP-binding protein
MMANRAPQPSAGQERAAIVLETLDLSVHFGGLWAVNGVSVAIESGGITSIIGPNGAGKSTFFNLISGAIRPSSGRILINGRPARSSPSKIRAQGLARSFQITNLFPQLSVFENLRLAAQILEPMARGFLPVRMSSKAEAKAEALLARFDLAHRAERLAGELSHGEQRRLEIAAALASEPQILLLDEPTQGMSHGDTQDTKALIKSLGGELTVLLIEHDIELVMDLSKHVVVLHQGSKLAEGSPAAVSANPEVQAAYFGGQ